MSPVEKDPSAGLNGMVAAVLRGERAANPRRVTQDEIAERSGIPIVSLRRYLNGQRHIDTAVLDAICAAMDLDPSWVLEQAVARRALAEAQSGELASAARDTGRKSRGQQRQADADRAGEPDADDAGDLEPR
jgi:transcriptional regulator with XRE-family HTH domain